MHSDLHSGRAAVISFHRRQSHGAQAGGLGITRNKGHAEGMAAGLVKVDDSQGIALVNRRAVLLIVDFGSFAGVDGPRGATIAFVI